MGAVVLVYEVEGVYEYEELILYISYTYIKFLAKPILDVSLSPPYTS
jgi:hypothetical protein